MEDGNEEDQEDVQDGGQEKYPDEYQDDVDDDNSGSQCTGAVRARQGTTTVRLSGCSVSNFCKTGTPPVV